MAARKPPGKTGKKTPQHPTPRRRGSAKKAAAHKVTPLLELAATWPFVTQKYMFGCEALLAGGRLFFIEMEEETVLRVGKDRLDAALRTRGSRGWNPWKPGEPGDWVSFPPARRQISKSLADWARTAYQAALSAPPTRRRRHPARTRGANRRPTGSR